MKKVFSDLDGVSLLFFLLGLIFVIVAKTQGLTNIGWIFIMVGIVKQVLEWGR